MTPEQERMAEWMRCKMHGCTATAVFGGLCMTHRDWDQASCEDCGQVFPLDELHGIIDGAGGFNICDFCYAKYERVPMAPDKNLTPELWY